MDELGAQERGIGVRENLSCLAWSNNDKWVVFAGSSGVAQVVNTETWELVYSLKYNGEICQVSAETMNPESAAPVNVNPKILSRPGAPVDSGAEHEKEVYFPQIGGRVSWTERPVVSRFLHISNLFLSPYLDNDPPLSLRVYVICMLMLESHVVWVSNMDHKVTEEITRLDDGEPLRALFGILKTAADVMTRMIENESTFEEWRKSSAKFDLTPRDMRRMHAWNERWRQVDANAPIVETSLLVTTDQLLS